MENVERRRSESEDLDIRIAVLLKANVACEIDSEFIS